VHEDGDRLCAEHNRKVAGWTLLKGTEFNVGDQNTIVVVQSVIITMQCRPANLSAATTSCG
jgi:hypothetical protein